MVRIKTFFAFLLLCTLYFILTPAKALAENEFTIDSTVTYNVSDTGSVEVENHATLVNNFSTLYADTYSLLLENVDVQNAKALEWVEDSYQVAPIEVKTVGPQVELKVTFNTAVVGKDKQRDFKIIYDNPKAATKTGEVWEISIPRLANPNDYRSYNLVLKVPDVFGKEAYITPEPDTKEVIEGAYIYRFNKNTLGVTGVTAGFGQFQVFTFDLSYHLENPLGKSAFAEIAIPPDSAYQKVYYTKVDPKPQDVKVDADGNWMAIYKLAARQRLDVRVVGSVQIFASYRNFPASSSQVLANNLKETDYWQTTDPRIKALAANLKTPRAIYDYVSNYLKYDTARVTPTVVRYGATKALENPLRAICMEFTDLFIAIARAAGIPAREINGFAYTENTDLQPLGLVADVLHSWPEYYDRTNHVWIPVDPTWGSTTGGVDFFSQMDLRHFAFVAHGESSTKPYPPGSYKLGTNPQKDVFVSLGKLNVKEATVPNISISAKKGLPFMATKYEVSIKNPGPGALYNLYPTIYFDQKEKQKDSIEILPPFATYTTTIEVPFSLLGKSTPDTVSAEVVGIKTDFRTNKTEIVLNSLVWIFVGLILLILFILVKLKKITFYKFTAKIKAWNAKITSKFKKGGSNGQTV